MYTCGMDATLCECQYKNSDTQPFMHGGIEIGLASAHERREEPDFSLLLPVSPR